MLNKKKRKGGQEHIHALQVLDDSARHDNLGAIRKLVNGNVTYKCLPGTPNNLFFMVVSTR